MLLALSVYTIMATVATTGIFGSCWLGCRAGQTQADHIAATWRTT